MQDENQSSPEESVEQENFIVREFSIDLDFAQHVGGVQSTEEPVKYYAFRGIGAPSMP